jgi:hypothetical protein
MSEPRPRWMCTGWNRTRRALSLDTSCLTLGQGRTQPRGSYSLSGSAMNGELLVRRAGGEKESLDTFVSFLPRLLGCGPWEEHESMNYVEERYYCCFVLGLRATASIADDSELPDYQFELYFDPQFLRRSTDFLVDLADCVARTLVLNGYEVVRPFDSAHAGKGALTYRHDPTAGSMPWEQIITEKIATGTNR